MDSSFAKFAKFVRTAIRRDLSPELSAYYAEMFGRHHESLVAMLLEDSNSRASRTTSTPTTATGTPRASPRASPSGATAGAAGGGATGQSRAGAGGGVTAQPYTGQSLRDHGTKDDFNEIKKAAKYIFNLLLAFNPAATETMIKKAAFAAVVRSLIIFSPPPSHTLFLSEYSLSLSLTHSTLSFTPPPPCSARRVPT